MKECRVRPRKCAVNSKTTVNCERVRGESKEKSSATTQIWNVTREVGQRQEEPATCVGGRTVIYFVSELENSDTWRTVIRARGVHWRTVNTLTLLF